MTVRQAFKILPDSRDFNKKIEGLRARKFLKHLKEPMKKESQRSKTLLKRAVGRPKKRPERGRNKSLAGNRFGTGGGIVGSDTGLLRSAIRRGKPILKRGKIWQGAGVSKAVMKLDAKGRNDWGFRKKWPMKYAHLAERGRKRPGGNKSPPYKGHLRGLRATKILMFSARKNLERSIRNFFKV